VAGDVSLMQAANRDKTFVTTIRVWKDLSFQDVAKKGLKYGDEGPEAEKKQVGGYTEQYRLLLNLFAKKANDLVKEVIISSRLVPSPCGIACVIVVDVYGYSVNPEKLLGEHNGSHANLCL